MRLMALAMAFAAMTAAAQEKAPARFEFKSADGVYSFAIDCSAAPELAAWSREKLAPVVSNWYPRIVKELASEGFAPRKSFAIIYKDGMDGCPAYTAGPRICLNHKWIASELKGEARGAVVHEMVHIVQAYGRGPKHAPGWVCEGLADYIRWFLYEPEKHGAGVRRGWKDARHDASYRISANFLDWARRKHGDGLVKNLNAAAREGRYDEALWKEWTGKTLDALDAEWKTELPE